jgi:hypothetical protein
MSALAGFILSSVSWLLSSFAACNRKAQTFAKTMWFPKPVSIRLPS